MTKVRTNALVISVVLVAAQGLLALHVSHQHADASARSDCALCCTVSQPVVLSDDAPVTGLTTAAERTPTWQTTVEPFPVHLPPLGPRSPPQAGQA